MSAGVGRSFLAAARSRPARSRPHASSAGFSKLDRLRRPFFAIGDADGGDGGAGGSSGRRTSRRPGGDSAGTGAPVVAAEEDTSAAAPFVDLNGNHAYKQEHEHDGVVDMAVGPGEGLSMT